MCIMLHVLFDLQNTSKSNVLRWEGSHHHASIYALALASLHAHAVILYGVYDVITRACMQPHRCLKHTCVTSTRQGQAPRVSLSQMRT
jgi:hypothetical protein